MSVPTLASRTFHESDQVAFANLSGDFNPVHMDPSAARKTQAGAVVVHGVHGALWALDKLAELGVITHDVCAISVQFKKFAYPGDQIDLRLLRRDSRTIVAELAIGTLTITTLSVQFGPIQRLDDIVLDRPSAEVEAFTQPANVEDINDLAQRFGWLSVDATSRHVEQHFPNAVSALGRERTAAIARLSTLVGMICPGLHSLFAAFSVKFAQTPNANSAFSYRVNSVDDRFRIVRSNVAGAGIAGSVQSFMRWPSVAQARIADIAALVSNTEFKGCTALIVGGSRGLGALTAKVIAAGGGEVFATYAKGRQEAEALADEIRGHVGSEVCRILPYDARIEPDSQLNDVSREITHLYYFATPHITKQKHGPFAPGVLDDFMQIYVNGFYRCCEFVGRQATGPVTAFYPSSVFVENGPPAMTEYAMAKSAGELLCHAIDQSSLSVRTVVERLPRLLTDQTATIPPVATRNPIEVMLPVIRRVQRP